jgi:hypothetical protein
MKKWPFLFVILILLSGITGCGKPPLTNDSSQVQSGKSEQSDESSQSGAVSSAENVGEISSAQGSQSESSSPAADPSSLTRQEVLSQISAALNTKLPLMLPTDVPVEPGRYLASTTDSQANSYKVNYYQTDQPAALNSEAASKGTLIATVEGTEYQDAADAKENISGYEQADTSNYGELLDLGHTIKAVGDAGLGHQYLVWNEGRWCLRVDSPTDPTYKNKEYPDNKQLAKNVVAYLEDHMLPAPQKIGVISVNIWNQSYGTTVEWQYNQMVYRISSQDPMTALKVAVTMSSL